jgi:hypothetical protein
MKARPAPLESMVTIVERSAMHVRSGPVRALFPRSQLNKSIEQFINSLHLRRGRVIHTLALLRALESHFARP